MVPEDSFNLVPNNSEGRHYEVDFLTSIFSVVFTGSMIVFALLFMFVLWKILQFMFKILLSYHLNSTKEIGGFVCEICLGDLQQASSVQKSNMKERLRSLGLKYGLRTDFANHGIVEGDLRVVNICRDGCAATHDNPDKSIRMLLLSGNVESCLFCKFVISKCQTCEGVRLFRCIEDPETESLMFLNEVRNHRLPQAKLPTYEEVVRIDTNQPDLV